MNSLQKESNRRVLIVDDEADVLDFLQLFLESDKWESTTVLSPGEAFAALKTQSYFLILTDIAMPDMDGYEFLKKIKSRGYTCEIALMTGFGYNPDHTLVKINKNGKYPCLFKPFNRARVSETIRAAWEAYHSNIPDTSI